MMLPMQLGPSCDIQCGNQVKRQHETLAVHHLNPFGETFHWSVQPRLRLMNEGHHAYGEGQSWRTCQG